MARRCDINVNKGVLTGNNVSHSNRKTRRRFLPNLQSVSLMSEALGKRISLKLAPSTVRTIEHNNGIDSYLLKTPARKLADSAITLKRRIQKALTKTEAAK